jgi:hypothetical protein
MKGGEGRRWVGELLRFWLEIWMESLVFWDGFVVCWDDFGRASFAWSILMKQWDRF